MIEANNLMLAVDDGKFIKFESSYAPPEQSIHSYLARVQGYAQCSDSCLVMMLIYIDQLIDTKGLFLSKLNIHRILITRYNTIPTLIYPYTHTYTLIYHKLRSQTPYVSFVSQFKPDVGRQVA